MVEFKMNLFISQEPSGRMFNQLCLDYTAKPHNPLLNR